MGEVESEDADAPQSEGELRSLVIDADQHGERLDRALVLCVPEFSRSYLQQLLAAGAARLNGQAVLKPKAPWCEDLGAGAPSCAKTAAPSAQHEPAPQRQHNDAHRVEHGAGTDHRALPFELSLIHI